MAWGFIQELPVTVEQYDQVDREITGDPEGLILHTASKKGDRVRVIDIWESEEAYRRFEQETLMPAIGRLGMEGPAEPPPMDTFELHNVRGPAAS